jgi:hypothetical protein
MEIEMKEGSAIKAAMGAEEVKITPLNLADLNSAELQEAARRCRLKSQAWLRNANLIEAWSQGRPNDKACN